MIYSDFYDVVDYIGVPIYSFETDPIIISESLSHTISLSQTQSHTLGLVESQTLSLTQSMSTTNIINISITQSLTLTQVNEGNGIKVTSSSITLTQSVSLHIFYYKTLTQSLNFLYNQSVRLLLNEDIHQSITFGSSGSNDSARPVSNELDLSQSVSPTYVFNISVEDDLVLLDGTIVGKPVHLFAHNEIEFKDPYYRSTLINNIPIAIPTVIVNVANPLTKKYCIRLRHPQRSILLPCPEWGDSEANVSSITTKRTMTGLLYTYVKSSDNRKLKYQIIVDRLKSLELRSFIIDHLSDVLTLENWKDEVWFGYITNNPFELTPTSRGVHCESKERVEFNLEFIGTRVR